MPSKKPHESQGTMLLRYLFTMGKRIFKMDDARKAAELSKIPQNQLAKILSNLAKKGRVLRLRRGLYLGIGLLPGETDAHPFVISAYLIQPSAISHWSAMQYHGLTEQVPQIITASTTSKVITPSMRKKQSVPKKSKHRWEVCGVCYEYITVQQKHYFGIAKIWIDDLRVAITDKERTILDLFIYPKMFGGIGEALAVLEQSIATIDIQKLVEYSIRYDKKSVSKRLGWALEYFGISTKLTKPLLDVPIHYYCRLDPSGPAKGPCDKRWMIQNNLMERKIN